MPAHTPVTLLCLPMCVLSCSLCCLCGTNILPNPSNMCVNCIRSQVDITEGIQKQVGMPAWQQNLGAVLCCLPQSTQQQGHTAAETTSNRAAGIPFGSCPRGSLQQAQRALQQHHRSTHACSLTYGVCCSLLPEACRRCGLWCGNDDVCRAS